MQNPITLNFIKYYPAPTSAGNAFTHANNFFAQGSRPRRITRSTPRSITTFPTGSVSARGTAWTGPDSGVANLYNNIAYSANPGTARSQNFVLDYTRTQNASTIFTARASVLRVRSVRDPLSVGFDATTLGLPTYMTADTGTKDFPRFSAQYAALGVSGYAIIHRYEDLYQYLGSMTKIIGGHTIKAGAEFRKIQENYYQPNVPGGSFTFNRKQTGLNPLSSSSSQGDGLASALLGFGSSGTVTIDYPTAQSAGYAGAYINDDWRVSRKLTLNFGLRWDADIPRTDRFDRINWLDLSAPAPIADNPQVKAAFPHLMGLMRFAGPGNRSPYDGDWKNFQPRFGFAYALNNKTTIRGAYGVFYTVSRHTVKGEVGTAFGFTDSSVPWSLDGGFTQYATFANPWPAGLTYPPGRNASAFLGLDAGTPVPYDRNPQYQQWNFSVQRELPGHGVLELNYSASKGTRLYVGDTNDAVSQLNNLNPMFWGMGVDALTSLVPNPFYGVITNPTATDYNQPTIQLNALLRAYPEYSGVGGYRAARNIGDSSYHSLQVKYEKRFSHGLSVVAHYTWSKMISDSDEAGSDVEWAAVAGSIQNLFNLKQERSVSGLNRPHVLVGEFRLPVADRPQPGVRQEHEPDSGRRDRRVGDQLYDHGAVRRGAAGGNGRLQHVGRGGAAPEPDGESVHLGLGFEQAEQLLQRGFVQRAGRLHIRVGAALPSLVPRAGADQRRRDAGQELQHPGAQVRAVENGSVQRLEYAAVGTSRIRTSGAPRSDRSPAPGATARCSSR